MQTQELSKEIVSKQKLLFGKFKPIGFEKAKDDTVHSTYYEKGYVVLKNVADYKEANSKIREFISGLDTSKVPLVKPFDSKIEIAKVDGIPICDDSVIAGCQALHFDLAQPFLAEEGHSVYVVIGLYRPLNGEPTDAKTRVVFLPNLAERAEKVSKQLVKQRLERYVAEHGDGWDEPAPVNTHRLALFGRFLDAIYEKNRLLHYRTATMAEWFSKEKNPGVMAERDFFKECGIDLTKAEERINLKPGELIIIDNIRCVHGRVGSREPEEIYQYMYGVKEAEPIAIQNMVDWLVGLFSK